LRSSRVLFSKEGFASLPFKTGKLYAARRRLPLARIHDETRPSRLWTNWWFGIYLLGKAEQT